MNWTKEQSDAIYKKGSNILVAAAAGSGKTAVLVERIIEKILKDNIDIDKLLVVTFTNAAAQEMRERVLEAIYKKIDEDPENNNLQKQVVLLGKSNICTIHSFCLDVIKNNFFELDISANFRIGSEEEIILLKQEKLEDVFERMYEDENESFLKLINTYTGYIGDEPLKEMILRIYNFMQSSPFPKKWLSEKVKLFSLDHNDKDFFESIWGKILLKNLKEELIDGINSLKIVRNKLENFYELEKYKLVIENDIEIYKELCNLVEKSWDMSFEYAQNIKLKTWPIDKKITLELKDDAKKSRDIVKNKLMKLIKELLCYNSERAYSDIYDMYEILKNLKDVIFEFDKEFKQTKKERNIIDFNDIEHYALEILVKQDKNGNYVPSEVAKKYQEKFEEIAIDEYQDSNQVQEFILNSVSRKNNIFMVGDVKQSIYKFRQACPRLFLNKYENYSLEGNEKGLKIQLFKNFRSRDNVLDITNCIFETIMSSNLGDNIDYTEEEYLNLGADFETIENGVDIAEFDIIDLKEEQEEINIWKSTENNEENEIADEDEFDLDKKIEKEEIEAKFVAKRIEEIINSGTVIKDKKLGLRKITYKDIVILLRSTSRLAPIYEKELMKKNIPVFSDSSTEYLDSIEIQTMIVLLKILDNPIDDISLVSLMRSEIGRFSDNEIMEIRLENRDDNFYKSLTNFIASSNKNEELKNKVNNFMNMLDDWRLKSDYLTLAELIWDIYVKTGYLNFVGLMPNGSLRQANLKMLFERAKEYEKTSFKGLYNFIKFIEKLKSGNSDMSAAKVIGENENVVRIMSIHKSKGLEFPVVFLSSTAKKINMQDLNSNLLLHEEIGIGPQYINYERMVEYSTSAKDAIKIIAKEENIAEEMRVLYVALTRAKEKLIITGICNDYQKELEKKNELLKIYNTKDGRINSILLKKYISYFDWIELVRCTGKLDKLVNFNLYKKSDVLNEEDELQEDFDFKFDFSKLDKEKIEKFNNEFSWVYPNLLLSNLPIKSTVSKIKEIKNESIDFDNLYNTSIGFENIVPSFLEQEEKITSSRKGTVTHLFLQQLDFKRKYSKSDLEELKNMLIQKKIITEFEAKFIYISKIEKFLCSKLAQKLKNSVKVEKEKAFCTKIKAKEIYENAKDEEILVQGIIDLYAITEENEIILVDYKTDFLKIGEENELIKKYYNQLNIYKRALEDATGLKVKNIYIYSLCLDKEIEI